MQFSSVDKKVVELLLRRKTIQAYLLHQELGFSASQIARSIENLASCGIVNYAEETMVVSLHDMSAPVIFKLREQIYNRVASWHELPIRFSLQDVKSPKGVVATNDRGYDLKRFGKDINTKIFEEVERQARKREG